MSKKGLRLIAYLLIVVGAAGLLLSWWIYDQQPREPLTPLGTKSVNAVQPPSSRKPSNGAITNYVVAPTLPKYIAIPAIGIKTTRVIQLGLLANGEIATPDNIYDTGWYNSSSKPGQRGAMFIYGHVSSWTDNGVFYGLKNLKPGNTVTITRGDNTTYTYSVVSTKIYPYTNVNMHEVLSPIDANQPGLNLMTCTGQVIKGTSEFNERLVVFTALVKK